MSLKGMGWCLDCSGTGTAGMGSGLHPQYELALGILQSKHSLMSDIHVLAAFALY